MPNYEYIIAGFPDLVHDFGPGNSPETEKVVNEVRSQLDSKDNKLIDWLLAGLDGNHLNSHFYNALKKTGNSFLISYFDFDKKVRMAKVAFIDNTAFNDQDDFDEYDKLMKIFHVKNIFDREKLLDNLMWNKAADLVTFDIFSIDTILSLITRLKIANRWSVLDKATGAQMFKRLVDEVRGTFKGINNVQL